MVRGLEQYKKMRDFSRSPEPSGTASTSSGSALYIMHKHAASHDHFDLRLEQDGVLRSWALPKGPSLAPGEKRLAVEVEDHPLDYGAFEGVIPQKEYGGGTVMLWDQGSWQLKGKAKADRLDFELHGGRLSGHWTLVRIRDKKATGPKADRNWLLIKRSDDENAAHRAEPPSAKDTSIVSGRTMAQIARNEPASARPSSTPAAADLPQAHKGKLPTESKPQLAALVETPPRGDKWIHELKFDGYRLLARVDNGKVTLFTRNGKDWTRRFPQIREDIASLSVRNALIDGEVVILEPDGSTSFRKLQEVLASKGKTTGAALVFQAFDLLFLDDYSLEKSPLLERKSALARILDTGDPGQRVRYSDHIRGQGEAFFEQVCEMGLEGMISKRADSSYQGGRQKTWLKTKCTRQDEFVVGGFTPPSGSRTGFGSLLLGAFDGDQLVYAGRVGAGFSSRQLGALHEALLALEGQRSPFNEEVPDTKGVRWVTPKLVVDVEFTERTGNGALRHPVFRGVREDKSAKEVQMSSSPTAQPDHKATTRKSGSGKKTGSAARPMVVGVSVTHPERTLFPDAGVTKLEVAQYYEDVAEWILPHLAERPLSMLRCPEGIAGDCFFQKHPDNKFARDVPRIAIPEKQGGTSDYLYVRSASDLVGLVQYGVLELHPWGCTIADIEHPDTLIFDLDPGAGVPWRQISEAARSLRERLQDLGLSSFLQATGGKGLHLIVPIKPGLSWEQAKAFAEAVCQAHAQDAPGAFTTNMAKNKRKGKIFLDYLRNGRGSTSIARYSTRARENATVATPLRWNELSSAASSNRYSISNVRRRLSALKKDPWEGYEDARRTITKAMLKQFRLE